MNVLIMILRSHAFRFVPGSNFPHAASAFANVSWTRSSASRALRVIRNAAGYNLVVKDRSTSSVHSPSAFTVIPGSILWRAGLLERCGDVPQGQVRLDVAAGRLPSGEFDVPVGQRLAGDLAEQVADDVEPGPF